MIFKLYITKLLFVTFLYLLVSSCYKEELILPSSDFEKPLMFDDVLVAFDKPHGMLLLTVNSKSLPLNQLLTTNYTQLKIAGVAYENGDTVNFGDYSLGDSLEVNFYDKNGTYTEAFLHFTTLPVIQVFTNNEIPDEPKVPCEFILSDATQTGATTFKSNAGIERRGRSAASQPKTSFGIELWKDRFGAYTQQESLLKMRTDDDWILDAMYIDKARMRNKLSMDLWRDICASSESSWISGKPYTESKYVEVFLNNQYQGVYCLTERVDCKQLGISKSDGYLYKAEVWTDVTKYLELSDTSLSKYWGGWELKNPDPDNYISWRPLYDFTHFVINSNPEEFASEIYNYLNQDNIIDYFLFINSILAFDNMGTNMYFAKYSKDTPFIIYPWDLDASWGRNWDSTLLGAEIWVSNPWYQRIFSNNLGNANEELIDRWNYLRQEIITEPRIHEQIQNNAKVLTESGAIYRESRYWPEMHLNLEQEIDFIKSWIKRRMIYIDGRVSAINGSDEFKYPPPYIKK